jgi:NAD(P)-dependent dehydrogenase (short-subunit alcohol dehydrogenase family)
MRLSQKNIVITGAGRGIGRQIAISASNEGANIALIARTSAELDETLSHLSKDGTHRSHILDIKELPSIETTFQKIFKEFGSIDGLVNNAGVQPPIGSFHQVSVADWIHNIEINLLGTMACTHAVLGNMIHAKGGKIVNLSGGGSTSPRQNFSAYGVAKTAIVRFTETIAVELQQYGIEVNAIAPGAINTKMLDEVLHMKDFAGAEYLDALKRKENGGNDPRVAADLVCFLLSSQADGITGKLISAQWDPWKTQEFQQFLRRDKDVGTLRRIDNKTFFKKA